MALPPGFRSLYDIYNDILSKSSGINEQDALELAKKEWEDQFAKLGLLDQMSPSDRMKLQLVKERVQPVPGGGFTFERQTQRQELDYGGLFGAERLGLPALGYEAEPGTAKHTALEAARGGVLGVAQGLGSTVGGWLARRTGLMDTEKYRELSQIAEEVGQDTGGLGRFFVEASKAAGSMAPAAAEAFGIGSLVGKASAAAVSERIASAINAAAKGEKAGAVNAIKNLAQRFGVNEEQMALLVAKARSGALKADDVAGITARLMSGKNAAQNLGLLARGKLPSLAATSAAFALGSSDLDPNANALTFAGNVAKNLVMFGAFDVLGVAGRSIQRGMLEKAAFKDKALFDVLYSLKHATSDEAREKILAELIKDIPLRTRALAAAVGNAIPIGGLALTEMILHGRSLPEALGAAVGIHYGGHLGSLTGARVGYLSESLFEPQKAQRRMTGRAELGAELVYNKQMESPTGLPVEAVVDLAWSDSPVEPPYFQKKQETQQPGQSEQRPGEQGAEGVPSSPFDVLGDVMGISHDYYIDIVDDKDSARNVFGKIRHPNEDEVERIVKPVDEYAKKYDDKQMPGVIVIDNATIVDAPVLVHGNNVVRTNLNGTIYAIPFGDNALLGNYAYGYRSMLVRFTDPNGREVWFQRKLQYKNKDKPSFVFERVEGINDKNRYLLPEEARLFEKYFDSPHDPSLGSLTVRSPLPQYFAADETAAKLLATIAQEVKAGVGDNAEIVPFFNKLRLAPELRIFSRVAPDKSVFRGIIRVVREDIGPRPEPAGDVKAAQNLKGEEPLYHAVLFTYVIEPESGKIVWTGTRMSFEEVVGVASAIASGKSVAAGDASYMDYEADLERLKNNIGAKLSELSLTDTPPTPSASAVQPPAVPPGAEPPSGEAGAQTLVGQAGQAGKGRTRRGAKSKAAAAIAPEAAVPVEPKADVGTEPTGVTAAESGVMGRGTASADVITVPTNATPVGRNVPETAKPTGTGARKGSGASAAAKSMPAADLVARAGASVRSEKAKPAEQERYNNFSPDDLFGDVGLSPEDIEEARAEIGSKLDLPKKKRSRKGGGQVDFEDVINERLEFEDVANERPGYIDAAGAISDTAAGLRAYIKRKMIPEDAKALGAVDKLTIVEDAAIAAERVSESQDQQNVIHAVVSTHRVYHDLRTDLSMVIDDIKRRSGLYTGSQEEEPLPGTEVPLTPEALRSLEAAVEAGGVAEVAPVGRLSYDQRVEFLNTLLEQVVDKIHDLESRYGDPVTAVLAGGRSGADLSHIRQAAELARLALKSINETLALDRRSAERLRLLGVEAKVLLHMVDVLHGTGVKLDTNVQNLVAMADFLEKSGLSATAGGKHGTRDIIFRERAYKPGLKERWRELPSRAVEYRAPYGLHEKRNAHLIARSIVTQAITRAERDAGLPGSIDVRTGLPVDIGRGFVDALFRLAISPSNNGMVSKLDKAFAAMLRRDQQLRAEIARLANDGKYDEIARLLVRIYEQKGEAERLTVPRWVYEFENLAEHAKGVEEKARSALANRQTAALWQQQKRMLQASTDVFLADLAGSTASLISGETPVERSAQRQAVAQMQRAAYALMKRNMASWLTEGAEAEGARGPQESVEQATINPANLRPADIYEAYTRIVYEYADQMDAAVQQGDYGGYSKATDLWVATRSMVNLLERGGHISSDFAAELEKKIDNVFLSRKADAPRFLRRFLSGMIADLARVRSARPGLIKLVAALDRLNAVYRSVRSIASSEQFKTFSAAADVLQSASAIRSAIYGAERTPLSSATAVGRVTGGYYPVDLKIEEFKGYIDRADTGGVVRTLFELRDMLRNETSLIIAAESIEAAGSGKKTSNVLAKHVYELLSSRYKNLLSALERREVDDQALSEAGEFAKDLDVLSALYRRASLASRSGESVDRQTVLDVLIKAGMEIINTRARRAEEQYGKKDARTLAARRTVAEFDRLYQIFYDIGLLDFEGLSGERGKMADMALSILAGRLAGVSLPIGFEREVIDASNKGPRTLEAVLSRAYKAVSDDVEDLIKGSSRLLGEYFSAAARRDLDAIQELKKRGRAAAIELASSTEAVKSRMRANAMRSSLDAAHATGERRRAFRELLESLESNLADRDVFSLFMDISAERANELLLLRGLDRGSGEALWIFARYSDDQGLRARLSRVSEAWNAFDVAVDDLLLHADRIPPAELFARGPSNVSGPVAVAGAIRSVVQGDIAGLYRYSSNLPLEARAAAMTSALAPVERGEDGRFYIDMLKVSRTGTTSPVRGTALSIEEITRGSVSVVREIPEGSWLSEAINMARERVASDGPIFPLIVRTVIDKNGRRHELDTRDYDGYGYINRFLYDLYRELGFDSVPVVFALDSHDPAYERALAEAGVRVQRMAVSVADSPPKSGVSEGARSSMRQISRGFAAPIVIENEHDAVAWGYMMGTRSVESLNVLVVRGGRVVARATRRLGNVNSVPSRLVNEAIEELSGAIQNGDKVVFMHTHPSGDALASGKDLVALDQIREQLSGVGNVDVVSIVTDGVFATVARSNGDGTYQVDIVPIPEDAKLFYEKAGSVSADDYIHTMLAKNENGGNVIVLYEVGGKVRKSEVVNAETVQWRQFLNDFMSDQEVGGTITFVTGFGDISDLGVRGIAAAARALGYAKVHMLNPNSPIMRRLTDLLHGSTGRIDARNARAINFETRDLPNVGQTRIATLFGKKLLHAELLPGERVDFDGNPPDPKAFRDAVRRGVGLDDLEFMDVAEEMDSALQYLQSITSGAAFKTAAAGMKYDVKSGREAMKRYLAETSSKKFKAHRNLVDEAVALKMLDDVRAAALGELAPEMRVYDTWSVLHNRIGGLLTIVDSQIADPIRKTVRSLTERGVSLGEIRQYLLAKHGLERLPVLRELIKSRYSKKTGMRASDIAELMDKLNALQIAGMSQYDMKRIVSSVEESPHWPLYKQMLDKIEELGRFRVNYAVACGLISKEDGAEMLKTYKYYVPFFEDVPSGRWKDVNEDLKRFGNFTKIRVAEDIIGETRTGGNEYVKDPIAALLSDTARLITAGQHNVLLNVMAGSERLAPTGLMTILELDRTIDLPGLSDVVPTLAGRDDVLARPWSPEEAAAVEAGEMSPHALPVRIPKHTEGALNFFFNGRQHQLRIHDPNIYRVLHGAGVYMANPLVRMLGPVTQMMVVMRTGLAPTFWVSNFTRDIISAALFLRGEYGAEYQKRFVRNVRLALRESWRANIEQSPSREFQEFLALGGRVTTGMVQEYNYKTILKRLTEIDFTDSSKAQLVLDKARALRDAMLAVSDTFELATRFAAYKTGLDMGLSPAESARLAAELTVNFSRKGEWAPTANAWYMFFKADMAAMERGVRALKLSRGVRRLVRDAVAFGIMLSMFNRMLADEENGESDWDKLNRDQKLRYLHFYVGRDERGKAQFLKIPAPHFFRTFIGLGQDIESLVLHPIMRGNGRVDGGQVLRGLVDSATAFVSAFNPLSTLSFTSVKSALLSAVPSVMRPAVALAANTSAFGNRIYPERMPWDVLTPRYQMAFRSTSPAYVAISRALSESTTDVPGTPGKVDIAPEIMQYIVNEAGGGVAEFIGDILTAMQLSILNHGINWEVLSQAPVTKRFFSEVGNEVYTGKYYELRRKLQEYGEMIKHGRRFDNWKQLMRAKNIVTAYDKKISALSRSRKRALERGQDTEPLDRQIMDLQKQAVISIIKVVGTDDI